jgi:hypothetical protein
MAFKEVFKCKMLLHKLKAQLVYSNELQAGWPGLLSQYRQELLFSTTFRPTVGLTQPPIKSVPATFFPEHEGN